MPDFSTEGYIYIQPNTDAYPVAMTFAACSAETTNDGSIPYGTTITSATVHAYNSDGTEVDDLVDDSTGVVSGGLTVGCALSYPTTSGDGLYTLEARLTLDTGAVLVVDARRVVVGDRST